MHCNNVCTNVGSQRSMPCMGRRGLEVLIRKLLLLPSRPVILMLNLWMPKFNRYSFWAVRLPADALRP